MSDPGVQDENVVSFFDRNDSYRSEAARLRHMARTMDTQYARTELVAVALQYERLAKQFG